MSGKTSVSHDDEGGRAAILEGTAALIIGHPGHELRVYRWLEIARPLTFVLTDGSGRGQRSRLPSTENILRGAGARAAPIFGRWTDAQAYEIFLSGNLGALTAVTWELAKVLVANRIEAVAADALEGINPTHDLCRYITNAAVLLARRQSPRNVANYDFILGVPPLSNLPGDGEVRIELDAEALDRKWQAAGNYPELRKEVLIAKVLYGRKRFATEILRSVAPNLSPGFSGQPHYEIYGKRRVKAGYYNKAIGYQEHVLPLIKALWRELDLPAF